MPFTGGYSGSPMDFPVKMDRMRKDKKAMKRNRSEKAVKVKRVNKMAMFVCVL